MKTLVLGATGATGKLLTEQLLEGGKKVKVIVRSSERLPDKIRNHTHIELIEGNVLDFDINQMSDIIKDCSSVGMCLGHNLTLKGIYGKPRRLVRDAVKLVCDAAINNKPDMSFRFVLMNTTGNRNNDLSEKRTVGEKIVMGLLRQLLPPQADNETAADHLRINIGQNHQNIEWVAVRPDGLIDNEEVSDYELFTSPQRSPIFNAGKTSRINVGHFMAKLITDDSLMAKWEGQMPVIYNTE